MRYSEIVGDYEVYKRLQVRDFCSFESQSSTWRIGQERYIQEVLSGYDRSLRVLDIACGDGVGLTVFAAYGFANVVGVELNPAKADRARQSGYPVFTCDMHALDMFEDGAFDVVYSSHTLEHAYYPDRAILEMRRVVSAEGAFHVVLPYPDRGDANVLAHGAKFELGTDVEDGADTVVRTFEARGCALREIRFASFREPEVWLEFGKVPLSAR